MSTKGKIYASRLQSVAQGEPWYGMSVKEALDKISETEASKKINKQHSIAEILTHMVQWKRFVFEKATGNDAFDIDGVQEQDWILVDKISEQEWKKLKSTYIEISDDLVYTVAHLKEDWFMQEVPGRRYSFDFLFNGAVEHDVYHLGQIALLHKMVHG